MFSLQCIEFGLLLGFDSRHSRLQRSALRLQGLCLFLLKIFQLFLPLRRQFCIKFFDGFLPLVF